MMNNRKGGLMNRPPTTTEPYGALPHSVAATMLAVLADRRPTLRGIRAHTGQSLSTIHYALVKLRAFGLVDWEDGKSATLHATCQRVDVPGVRLTA